MKKVDFKSVLKFTFKGNHYEMFKTSNEEIAFLKITENGYDYPTIQEFEELTGFFEHEKEKTISFFKNNTKYRFIPCVKGKLNGQITTVAITSMLVLATLTGCKNVDVASTNYATIQVEETKTFEEEPILNGKEKVEKPTSKIDELLNNVSDVTWVNENDIQDIFDFDASTIDYINDGDNKHIYLFNDKYFDLFFGNENQTIENINNVIENNQNIPEQYKDFVKEFSKTMLEYYPEIDTRIYKANLENISFATKEKEQSENDAIAYHDTNTNTIYLDENFKLDDITSKIVLRHELGHLFNNININRDDYAITYSFNYKSHGNYLKEGLNVLFTTKPFEEEYKDLYINKGYPILANIAQVITDATDYNFNNYVSQNIYSFEKEVNMKSNNPTGFNYIEDIYENIWYDYITFSHLDENNELIDEFSIDQEYYQDFYEYITKLYLDKYYGENLSDEEIEQLAENYLRILTQNISNFNVVDYNTIKNTFSNYTLDKASSLTK